MNKNNTSEKKTALNASQATAHQQTTTREAHAAHYICKYSDTHDSGGCLVVKKLADYYIDPGTTIASSPQ
jgi:3'-phosphoadenosine 5'-phosphosulfate (PAPS) 3'-phosphatase